jgi:hypothetical protein
MVRLIVPLLALLWPDTWTCAPPSSCLPAAVVGATHQQASRTGGSMSGSMPLPGSLCATGKASHGAVQKETT